MNRDRLLRLADLLEKDAANPTGIKFDMGSWGDVEDLDNPVSCGTTACAAGLACLSGIFKDDGLNYDASKVILDGGKIVTIIKPIYQKTSDYSAMAEFFEISLDTASFLFSPLYYSQETGARAELEVARRIHDIVANGEREWRWYRNNCGQPAMEC